MIEYEMRVVGIGTRNLQRTALVARETIGAVRLRPEFCCFGDCLPSIVEL
jgi:hypothetical protein